MIRPFSFIAVVIAVVATQANAGVIINTLPRNDQAGLNAQAGQTFTTGTLGAENQLSTIEIAGPSSTGANVGNVQQIHLFVDTDGNPNTWDPGTSVAVSTNALALPIGGTSIYNFSNELLADNTVYALLFETTGGVAQAARVGMRGNANPLAGGTVFASGTPQFSGNFDLAFSVTTVPEPGSLALLGLGLAGLIGIRRRRR